MSMVSKTDDMDIRCCATFWRKQRVNLDETLGARSGWNDA